VTQYAQCEQRVSLPATLQNRANPPATGPRCGRWWLNWLPKGASMEKSSLTALAREQLKIARQASSGRSAKTVYGGHEHVLRQTMIALAAGHRLDEHDNPGEATVHVLHGRVRLSAGEIGWEGSPGDLLIVPVGRHALDALEDSAVLLTVAKHG
jgi:quercetin dioxygenase-like cupin family protein